MKRERNKSEIEKNISKLRQYDKLGSSELLVSNEVVNDISPLLLSEVPCVIHA